MFSGFYSIAHLNSHSSAVQSERVDVAGPVVAEQKGNIIGSNPNQNPTAPDSISVPDGKQERVVDLTGTYLILHESKVLSRHPLRQA